MSLSVTGSSIFLGQGLVGGDGIEFIPTNMDAVDAHGQRAMNGERLHIMKAPLTNGQRNHINAHLGRHRYGSMLMYESGTAYVVRRGTELQSRAVCRRSPLLDADDTPEEVYSVKQGLRFVPDSALVLANPDFMAHPAADMTWYEAASLAAALEDADPQRRFRIRMMRSREYDRFLNWDSKYPERAILKRAHLYGEGSRKTLSVSDEAAQHRTTEEGFVDVFGNVAIWMDDLKIEPTAYAGTVDMDELERVISKLSATNFQPSTIRGRRDVARPYWSEGGVRFVAVPASGVAVPAVKP